MQSISVLGKDCKISMCIIKNQSNNGFEFIADAITDSSYNSRFSINGHLGSGFEIIKRKMDDFCISSSGGRLKLVTRKWIPVA